MFFIIILLSEDVFCHTQKKHTDNIQTENNMFINARIDPFTTDNTLGCGWRFETATIISLYDTFLPLKWYRRGRDLSEKYIMDGNPGHYDSMRPPYQTCHYKIWLHGTIVLKKIVYISVDIQE